MTTRRNFIKGVGVAMAATPFTALMLGSKNAEAAPKMVQVCLRCVQRETPCFCHTQRLCGRVSLPSCPWYDINDNLYNVGDTYLNSLDNQTYTYTAGKDGYPNFWQPNHSLMCICCLHRARESFYHRYNYPESNMYDRDLYGYSRMLSITCNTWPPYTDKWEGKCCCGHPWLKTATEDYARRLKGESDKERENRRNYPIVRLWKQYRRHYGMFDTAPAVMGVDQIAPFLAGDTLQYHYRIPNGSGYGVANWNELADIMRDRQIHMCVLDPQPDRFQARKFQRLFPGHVVFCQYRQCETPLVWNRVNYPDNSNVFANRSYWYRGDHPAAFCEIAQELEYDRRVQWLNVIGG